MKPSVFLFCTGSLLLLACHKHPKDAKALADSLNKVRDTTKNAGKTGGIGVNNQDARFATAVVSSSMAEIAMSKMALVKSTYISIKNLARVLINDSQKIDEALTGIAKKENITLPGMPDSAALKQLNRLKGLNDAAFDKAYVKAMIDSHKMTLDLVLKEAREAQDVDLKSFAGKIMPTVKKHLDAIKEIGL